jgi:hypothetical protein
LNPRRQPWQGCTLPLSYSRKEQLREDAYTSQNPSGLSRDSERAGGRHSSALKTTDFTVVSPSETLTASVQVSDSPIHVLKV